MEEKVVLRREMLARREVLTERQARSSAIAARVQALDAFLTARVISAYVGVGAEVSTVPLIEQSFSRGLPVAVPWVDADGLHLTAIRSLDEVEPAPFGLLEPPPQLRNARDRSVAPSQVQVYLVPGLAFDRSGGRLGYGRGYYDRLLRSAGRAPLRIGLGFEAQVVERVPMTQLDEPMDVVVTEAAVYRVSARTASEVR